MPRRLRRGAGRLPAQSLRGADPAREIAEACALYDLRPLGGVGGSGASTSSAPDVELKITVVSPDRVIVEEVPTQDSQRLIATLLAAVLLVALVVALADLARRRRGGRA